MAVVVFVKIHSVQLIQRSNWEKGWTQSLKSLFTLDLVVWFKDNLFVSICTARYPHTPGSGTGPGSRCWTKQTFLDALQVSVICFEY